MSRREVLDTLGSRRLMRQAVRAGRMGLSGEEQLDIPVEYDSKGLSTGVEAEEEPRDGLIHEPFDPAKIDVQTRVMTVDLLLRRLRRGVLDLAPDFQRFAGIWTEVAQSRLIESLLLRIPLPTLYAAESGEESWAIVDGIQRLTTIARFVSPEVIDAEPLTLRGLEYLRYDGYKYSELPGGLQTRIDETELVIHLIRAGTPEPVKFNIFARINTGGRALTLQELRHALIPGRARELLAELADSEAFLEATLRSVKKDRMADREMVLRFLAFRLTEPADYPRGDLDVFLRQAMKRINTLDDDVIERLSEDFERAMRTASEIFGEHAFRKRFPGQNRRLPINKALFEAISVNLAKMTPNMITSLQERQYAVQEYLVSLMEDDKFLQAISVSTGDAEKVRRRFGAVERLLREAVR
jgi:CRISPR/Cas system CSM-associated protein Csm2 small subunit